MRKKIGVGEAGGDLGNDAILLGYFLCKWYNSSIITTKIDKFIKKNTEFGKSFKVVPS